MLTPSPSRKILRKMSYISDQQGILRRYLREKEGWKSHLDQAGGFITEVLKSGDYNHIIVLGSGWLLDFPIEKILQYVKKVTLVDVFFPPQVLRIAKNSDKVECISADITGGYIGAIYTQIKESKSDFYIPENIEKPQIIPENGKLIISLNILNQLDILLADFIKKKRPIHNDLILKFRRIIQESHVEMLKHHPFILITDFKEILINSRGSVMEEKELVFTELPEGDMIKEWDWQFDFQQLYNANANTVFKVRAVYSAEMK